MKISRKKNKTTAIQDDKSGVQPVQPRLGDRSLWMDPFVHVLLILATGFVVYFNSMSVPFIFDDYDCILENPAITSFSSFPFTQRVMDLSIVSDIQNNIVLRPVAYFTFALNYALHEFNVFGYHLVNLLFHIGCALLLYYLFSQILSLVVLPGEEKKGCIREREDMSFLPLFASLLFVCHPMQTQAITYITQRFVPLATFFYLAAMVFYLQFRLSPTPLSRILTYFISLTAAVLAMESKEIAFTLPVVIALAEFIFFSGNIMPRVVRLIPFVLTMAIIPVKLMQLSSPESTGKTENVSGAINLVNFGGISSWDYLMTQFGVITTYIRLLLLPIGQNLDYDYPLQQSFFKLEVILPLIFLLIIVFTGFYLLSRSRVNPFYKIISFGIFWFFITLSVESSIVPIDDLIFEHRAYLPSIGFFMSLLAGAAVIFQYLTGKSICRSKKVSLLLTTIVLALSVTAITRNMVWKSPLTIWSDVIKKSPNKARGYAWLGEAYLEQVFSGIPPEYIYEENNSIDEKDARIEAAIQAYKKASELSPSNPIYFVKLGESFLLQGNHEKAELMFAKAQHYAPDNPWPSIYRGDILKRSGDHSGARQKYNDAIELEPRHPSARMRLADLYIKDGNIVEAEKILEYLMQIFPEESTRQKLEKLRNR